MGGITDSGGSAAGPVLVASPPVAGAAERRRSTTEGALVPAGSTRAAELAMPSGLVYSAVAIAPLPSSARMSVRAIQGILPPQSGRDRLGVWPLFRRARSVNRTHRHPRGLVQLLSELALNRPCARRLRGRIPPHNRPGYFFDEPRLPLPPVLRRVAGAASLAHARRTSSRVATVAIV